MRRINAQDEDKILLNSGDTFSRTIVDVSQGPIEIEIRGGVLRNCAFVGKEGIEINVKVPAHEEATMTHLYLGDGDGFSEGFNQGFDARSPIIVDPKHRGLVLMHELNVQGFSAHGVEASAPGRPTSHSGGGEGGVTRIKNSFIGNCDYEPITIGSDGSILKNCIVNDEIDHDGIHVKYGDVRVEDCSVSTGRNFAKISTDEHGRNRSARANFTYCDKSPEMGRFDLRHGGIASGHVADETRKADPPQGVPLTAQEAVEKRSSATGPVFP